MILYTFTCWRSLAIVLFQLYLKLIRFCVSFRSVSPQRIAFHIKIDVRPAIWETKCNLLCYLECYLTWDSGLIQLQSCVIFKNFIEISILGISMNFSRIFVVISNVFFIVLPQHLSVGK